MTEALPAVVAALARSSEQLDEASGRLGALDPGPATFGAAGPGALGELGHGLHLHWQRALGARAREAAAFGAVLDDIADSLTRAAADYAATDDAARRRLPGVS